MSNHKIILQKDIPKRTHISHNRMTRLSSTKSLFSINMIFDSEPNKILKPDGFWASIKWYWIEELMKGYHYNEIDYTFDPYRKYYVDPEIFVYEVNIDENTFVNLNEKKGLDKILQLKTYSDMLNFYDKYGFDIKEDSLYEYIDWKKVYMDYGGIELSVGSLWDLRINNKNLKRRWYSGWDISSVCIWNNELVKLKWIA